MMLGKIAGRRRRGRQRARWLGGIADSADVSLQTPRIVKAREAWRAAVPGAAESDTPGRLTAAELSSVSWALPLCCAWPLSHVRLSVTPRTAARQAPLSAGILQARTLQWIATPSSRGSSQPGDGTQASHIAGRFFPIRATREAHAIQ